MRGEMAARAVARTDTVDYPNTKAGQARAQAYVEEHWPAIKLMMDARFARWQACNLTLARRLVQRPLPVRAPHVDYFPRLHWRLRNRLPIWVVYAPVTREYPGRWVARMHVTLPKPKPTRFVITADTLEALRGVLPPGLTNLGRQPGDVREIVEVWL